jgi:hypothetical protein
VFETVDRRLEAWTKEVFDGETVEIAFARPGPGKSSRGIGLHLLEAIPTPPLSTPRRPPLQATLRYLVTSWADSPQEEHRLLGELLFAALDWKDVDVETEPLAPAAWTALQAPLRPSFVLRATARRERPEPPVKRVQHPLTFKTTAMASLQGRVVGPKEMPIMGAQVEVPWLGRSATTDADGAFVLSGVPRTPAVKRLQVRAKGLEMTVDVEKAAAAGEPILIRMKGLED